MGLAIRELIQGKEVEIKNLQGKVLAVDSFNTLYQFITTIRSRDGTPLMDSNNNITSHLVGLFSRTTSLLSKKLKPCFVFDGKPPELKKEERQRRKEIKQDAEKKYKKAVEEEDIEEMKKYAARTSRLTKEMVEEAKDLVKFLGLPVIEAPSEGEAQAAAMVKNNDAYACVSQDFDSLLHGATNLLRNLSISAKRKLPGKVSYQSSKPELINLTETLNHLGIDQNQLIALAMLVGTDYNIGGIPKIGPKKGITLVKEFKTDLDALFKKVEWDSYFDYPWTEVYYLIKKMPTTKKYILKWNPPQEEKIIKLLVDKHDFSEERVNSSLKKILENKDAMQQKALGDFS